MAGEKISDKVDRAEKEVGKTKEKAKKKWLSEPGWKRDTTICTALLAGGVGVYYLVKWIKDKNDESKPATKKIK